MNNQIDISKPNKFLSIILMGGHICVDTAQGGLAALLPFLVLHFDYTYMQVSILILASNMASAFIQPLFGWLGDKKARPWFMALGVVLAGSGIAAIGVSSVYAVVVASACISGIGNAMLHPEGGRIANLVGGLNADDKAVSMSLFSVGGQIGFCLGPIVTVAAVSAFGLPGTLVYLLFSLPYAVLLLAFNSRFSAYGVSSSSTVVNRALSDGEDSPESIGVPVRERWGAFAIILGSLSIRSVVFYGITSFVPLFVVGVLSQSEDVASSTITVFALVGAFATLMSGKVAQHVKVPNLMICCFIVLACALTAFTSIGSLGACLVLLGVMAVCLNLFNPPAITYGQAFVPAHLGMASGLAFGVAVCVGGVASPFLGALGDSYGLTLVIWMLIGFSIIGLACSIAARVIKPPQ